MSNRRCFKNIIPDRKILDHLDHLGLGYGTKSTRKLAAAKYGSSIASLVQYLCNLSVKTGLE